MTKCIGCGLILDNKETNLCERCFRIRNYNEYKNVKQDGNNFIKILNHINETNDLVLLVIDLLNFSDFKNIKKYITNDIILVLTKYDLLPKGIYEKKILGYFNNTNLNIVDKIVISSKKNYNLDSLYNMILKHKRGKNVFVIGYTSAGKSTLINKMIYNYTNLDRCITTSILPSTTLDTIIVPINDDLNIIDTPGLLKENSIYNYVDYKMYKKIVPTKPIKPIIYQVKVKQLFIIENILKVEIESSNNIVFYISNLLNIKRVFKNIEEDTSLERHIINTNGKEDIVISGLGFIKVMFKGSIIIHTLKGVNVYTRKSLL